MPKTTVKAMKGEARAREVHVTLVRASILDGIWALWCNGSLRGHECPVEIEPGDTWSDLGACMADAIAHIELHEDQA